MKAIKTNKNHYNLNQNPLNQSKSARMEKPEKNKKKRKKKQKNKKTVRNLKFAVAFGTISSYLGTINPH